MGFWKTWVNGFAGPDEAYKTEIRTLTPDQLRQREAELRRSKRSSGLSTAGSTTTLTATAAATVHTLGGLAPTMAGPATAFAVSARRYYCARQKHKLVKNQLEAQGIKRLPTDFTRDYLIPGLAGLAGTIASFVGAEIGFTDALAIVAPGGGEHVVAFLVNGNGPNLSDAFWGFEAGFNHAAQQAGELVNCGIGDGVPHVISDFAAFQEGFENGVGLFEQGLREGIAVVAPGLADAAVNGTRSAGRQAKSTLANQGLGAVGKELGEKLFR